LHTTQLVGLDCKKMGQLFGLQQHNKNITITGLDATGKLALVHRIVHHPTIIQNPNDYLNYCQVQQRSITFRIFCSNFLSHLSRGMLMSTWKRLNNQCDGLIFLIDSNDRYRMPESKETLELMLSDESLRNTKVLIVATKTDLPFSMQPHEIIEEFELNQIKQDWILETCAINETNAKIQKAVELLYNAIDHPNKSILKRTWIGEKPSTILQQLITKQGGLVPLADVDINCTK